MRVVDSVTSPGGRKPNEDRVGNSDCLAWVLDGATDLETDTVLPAGSDVQWLVDRVDAFLRETTTDALRAGPEALLRGLSLRVGDEMRSLGFPDHRIHPTCSVGLLAMSETTVRLCRIGDPTCLALGQETIELSTGFFGVQESRAVSRAKSRDPVQEDVRKGIVARRRQYITGVLGESVFSGHPEAGLKIQSATVESARARHVLLCSDGFARAVVDYRLYADWPTLVRVALRDGLATVVRGIRQHEDELMNADGKGVMSHFKNSDDATAMLIAL